MGPLVLHVPVYPVILLFPLTMGVKTLWSLLECCSEQVSDEHLRGASMAVDLAGWVVQNSQCQGMAGHVSRPHLRNLFFRASALLSLGARPVFVLDGAAPELKRQTLAARKQQQQTQSQQQGTQSQSQAAAAEVKSLSRSRLRALMGECRFLLEAMGLPCVQARCEAEALCAQLNLAGLVDAVVTEDSDALCHGATVMLRGFSVQSGGVAAERYRLERLRSSLGVTRERAVAAAILLGCDYFPTGVPGVGREAVLQLMTGWHRDWDALEILRHWRAQEFAPQEDDGRTCPVCSLGDGVHHCQKCKDFTDRVSVPETKGQRDCRCVILSENKKLLKTEASVKKKYVAVWIVIIRPYFCAHYPSFLFSSGACLSAWTGGTSNFPRWSRSFTPRRRFQRTSRGNSRGLVVPTPPPASPS